MMKLGICTLVPYDNYGGILQGYALQTTLENLGHEAYIMNTKLYNYISWKRKIINIVKWKIHRMCFSKDVPCINIYKYQSYRVKTILPFIKKWIKLTRAFTSVQDIYNFEEKEKFDGFVVGSDQVWRPRYSPDLFHMFLDFLPEKSPKKRIAYAASFGIDQNPFTQQQLDVCKKLVQRFDAVSVREQSGVNLCKTLFGIDAQWVLDPTMLLSKEDYLKLIEGYQPVYKNIELLQYVFFFDHDEKFIIDKVSKLLKLTPSNLMTKRFLNQVYSKDQLREAVFLPVEEWIYAYSHAKFVITDSFHGTVFCLIFNVPFIVVSPEAPTRIKSLLSLFNLTERLVVDKKEITESLINGKINWSFVNSKVHDLKKKSLTFLTNSLECNE